MTCPQSDCSWWQRIFAPPVAWGLPLPELTTRYPDAVARGWVRPGFPGQQIVVRPAWASDFYRTDEARRANKDWLGPWEATLPLGASDAPPTLAEYRRRTEKQMAFREALYMVVEADYNVAGVVSVTGVQHGAMSLGTLGYWAVQRYAGYGMTSLAVATVVDLLIGQLGLHRLEINVRPENEPSLALCRSLGFRPEGLRKRFMNIAGQWADHEAFAVDAEMLAGHSLVDTRLRGRHLAGRGEQSREPGEA